jgi:hypothetical protein
MTGDEHVGGVRWPIDLRDGFGRAPALASCVLRSSGFFVARAPFRGDPIVPALAAA